MALINFFFKNNSQWEVEAYTMYEVLDTPLHSYPVIGICVQLYRRPLYYVLNVMMPTVLLNVLSLLVFHLPAESGEKLSLGVTVMLAYAMVLLIIFDLTPPSGQNIPLVCEYELVRIY